MMGSLQADPKNIIADVGNELYMPSYFSQDYQSLSILFLWGKRSEAVGAIPRIKNGVSQELDGWYRFVRL